MSLCVDVSVQVPITQRYSPQVRTTLHNHFPSGRSEGKMIMEAGSYFGVTAVSSEAHTTPLHSTGRERLVMFRSHEETAATSGFYRPSSWYALPDGEVGPCTAHRVPGLGGRQSVVEEWSVTVREDVRVIRHIAKALHTSKPVSL